MKNTILVPIDFSKYSLVAFEHAVRLARGQQAKLALLHVVDRVHYSKNLRCMYDSAAHVDDLIRKEVSSAEKTLDGLAVPLRKEGLEVSTLTPLGDPATEILKTAIKAKAEMIVMGTHGRTGLAHLLHGSVAEKVMRKANCPVVTLRTKSRRSSRQKAAA